MARVFNATNNQFNQGVIFTSPVVTGPISITSAGVISESVAAVGLLLEGGAYNVNVSGFLSATAVGSYGLSLGLPAAATPNQISTVVIGTTGEIYGANYAISSYHATNITNNGVLLGANGIYVTANTGAYAIVNTGEIEALEGGFAIWSNGGGSHKITNSGTIWGNINGSETGAAVETIINSGFLFGEIYAREGNDSITNSGTIDGAIFLDGGADILVNTGTVYGDINGWLGADNLRNAGTLNGALLSGADNDILTNSGTINGNVDAWTGNDTFTNTGTVNGWIFLGLGTDKFIGGAKAENVADEEGADRYDFGDGLDNFDAVGAGSSVGNDIVNGGLNAGLKPSLGLYGDEYNASDALANVSVNMHTVARVDSVSGLSYLASRVQGADTGIDTITGFETVYVGAGNDVVFGSAVANYISGAAGDDHLYGGAGNDHLEGGIGSDFLVGEAGKDTIDVGIDTDVDTVAYKALTESTGALTGRDTLWNFGENDVIDFHQLVVAGGDVNHFVGVDVAFDDVVGAVRVLTTAAGWTVQVDSNGDMIADMVINVGDADHAGVTNWSDNFLF